MDVVKTLSEPSFLFEDSVFKHLFLLFLKTASSGVTSCFEGPKKK